MKLATVLQLKKVITVACAVLVVLLIAAIGCSQPQRFSSSFSPTENFADIKWPSSTLAQLLPEPESKYGAVNADSADLLMVDIGNTEKTAYDKYVQACMDKGFIVDYYRSETLFTAQDEAGHNLSLWYDEDDRYMTISLETLSNESNTSASNTALSESASEQEGVTNSTVADVDSVKPVDEEIATQPKIVDRSNLTGLTQGTLIQVTGHVVYLGPTYYEDGVTSFIIDLGSSRSNEYDIKGELPVSYPGLIKQYPDIHSGLSQIGPEKIEYNMTVQGIFAGYNRGSETNEIYGFNIEDCKLISMSPQ